MLDAGSARSPRSSSDLEFWERPSPLSVTREVAPARFSTEDIVARAAPRKRATAPSVPGRVPSPPPAMHAETNRLLLAGGRGSVPRVSISRSQQGALLRQPEL